MFQMYVPVQLWFNKPLPTFPSRFCIWHWRWGQEAWTVRGGLKAGTISEAPAQVRNALQCNVCDHDIYKHHSVCVKKTYQKHQVTLCNVCKSDILNFADISLTDFLCSLLWQVDSQCNFIFCLFVLLCIGLFSAVWRENGQCNCVFLSLCISLDWAILGCVTSRWSKETLPRSNASIAIFTALRAISLLRKATFPFFCVFVFFYFCILYFVLVYYHLCILTLHRPPFL